MVFFVKNRIDKGKLIVKVCPNNLTIGDYFTKSLQVKVFWAMGAVAMGHKPLVWLKTVTGTSARVKNFTPSPQKYIHLVTWKRNVDIVE